MKFLICVMDSSHFDQVLDNVKPLMNEEDSLIILNIASYDMYYLNKTEEEESLAYLYNSAISLGANVKVIRTNDLYATLVNFIESTDVTDIFIEDRREFRILHGLEEYVKENEERKIRCTFLKL